ncbi:hypothetical protein C5I_0117205, partial [Pseudomonas syringae pv. syringae FF5]
MKLITRERDIYRLRAAKTRWLNTLARKSLKYKEYTGRPPSTRSGRHAIVAPRNLSVYSFGAKTSPYPDTLVFVDELRRNFMIRDCFVDFRNTERVTAAALVLIYAAIDTARNERSAKADIIWSNKSQRVNVILRANNLHKLIRGEEIRYSLSDVKTMPIVSSVGSEMMEEIIDFIQSRIYQDKMSPDTEHFYGDAVSETINNVRLHAYPGQEPSAKKWWLTCSTIGNQLYLAIYDNGVGIPKTVIERPWFISAVQITHPQEYADLLAQFPEFEDKKPLLMRFIPTKISDDKLIYMSMQGDVSGTKIEKHGQGSKSIMALVGDTTEGVLWVFSNGGLYK